MKYFLILLNRGQVVDVNSYDEREARDRSHAAVKRMFSGWVGAVDVYGVKADEVQTLDQVS